MNKALDEHSAHHGGHGEEDHCEGEKGLTVKAIFEVVDHQPTLCRHQDVHQQHPSDGDDRRSVLEDALDLLEQGHPFVGALYRIEFGRAVGVQLVFPLHHQIPQLEHKGQDSQDSSGQEEAAIFVPAAQKLYQREKTGGDQHHSHIVEDLSQTHHAAALLHVSGHVDQLGIGGGVQDGGEHGAVQAVGDDRPDDLDRHAQLTQVGEDQRQTHQHGDHPQLDPAAVFPAFEVGAVDEHPDEKISDRVKDSGAEDDKPSQTSGEATDIHQEKREVVGKNVNSKVAAEAGG